MTKPDGVADTRVCEPADLIIRNARLVDGLGGRPWLAIWPFATTASRR